ncbi:molecular chaperone DnaJ [Bradyrhizobium sp. USDA 4341]
MHAGKKPPNPFEVLGVGPDADDKRVRDAFNRVAMDCHPDKKPGDETAAARFIVVRAAYDRIKTTAMRRAVAIEYGMMVTAAPGTAELNSAFSSFYKIMDSHTPAWGKRYNVPSNGANVLREMSITLEQAYRGGSFSMEYPAARCGGCHGAGRIQAAERQQCPTCAGDRSVRSSQSRIKVEMGCPTCEARGWVNWVICRGCGGAGQVRAVSAAVDVPRGVISGEEILLKGYGSPGTSGGAAGDLIVKIRVLEHPAFRREENDLLHRIKIHVWDAALGVKRSIRGIDGGLLEYEVPAGCQPGSVVRVPDGGMPVRNGGRGDLLIAVDVRIPNAGEGAARDAFLRVRRELGARAG